MTLYNGFDLLTRHSRFQPAHDVVESKTPISINVKEGVLNNNANRGAYGKRYNFVQKLTSVHGKSIALFYYPSTIINLNFHCPRLHPTRRHSRFHRFRNRVAVLSRKRNQRRACAADRHAEQSRMFARLVI